MELLVPRQAPAADGTLVKITPQAISLGQQHMPGRASGASPHETAGWRYVGFQAVRLQPGQRFEGHTQGEETCAVLLAGRCRVVAGENEWAAVGMRESVFDGPPHAVYLPPGTQYVLEALSSAVEIAIVAGAAIRRVSSRPSRSVYRRVGRERPSGRSTTS
jgi:5-deoxy-glucuronate isomerase